MKTPFTELTLRAQPSLPNFEEPRCFVFGSDDAVRRVYGVDSFQPRVDFAAAVLVAVHRGMARTGGYGIHVEAIEVNDQRVTLRIRRTDPPAGAFVTAVLTYPLTFIRLERSDLGGLGPWTFEFHDEKGHLFATVHEQV